MGGGWGTQLQGGWWYYVRCLEGAMAWVSANCISLIATARQVCQWRSRSSPARSPTTLWGQPSVLSRKEAVREKGGLEAMAHSTSGKQLHYPREGAGGGEDIGYAVMHAVMQASGTRHRAGRRVGLRPAVRLSPTAGVRKGGVCCHNPPQAHPIHPPPCIPSEDCQMRTVMS